MTSDLCLDKVEVFLVETRWVNQRREGVGANGNEWDHLEIRKEVRILTQYNSYNIFTIVYRTL